MSLSQRRRVDRDTDLGLGVGCVDSRTHFRRSAPAPQVLRGAQSEHGAEGDVSAR